MHSHLQVSSILANKITMIINIRKTPIYLAVVKDSLVRHDTSKEDL